MRVVFQCRQKPDFKVCCETIGWKRDYDAAKISAFFGNSQIERYTRAKGGIIPYSILVGTDVTTRLMEEKHKREEQERKKRELVCLVATWEDSVKLHAAKDFVHWSKVIPFNVTTDMTLKDVKGLIGQSDKMSLDSGLPLRLWVCCCLQNQTVRAQERLQDAHDNTTLGVLKFKCLVSDDNSLKLFVDQIQPGQNKDGDLIFFKYWYPLES